MKEVSGAATMSAVPELSVRALIEDPHLGVKLRRVAGETGLDRPLRHPRVQKAGLALAGHYHGVVPTRVQILGETELSYLDSLGGEERGVSARGLFSLGLSCVIVTGDHDPPRPFVTAAEATSTPLLVTPSRSSRTINALHAVLDDRLAPSTQLHAVLVDVFGVGLLLLGKSGIGKSECALELVMRGHRLVADDVVRCDWRPPGMIFGQPADLLRHHIEIRGLGVLNIKEMFGVTSVRERKRIDIVVQLVDWDDNEPYDRIGLEQRYFHIFGTPIRELKVPIRPGRDMGSLLEIAARNELLRRAGIHTPQEFMNRIDASLLADSQTQLEREPESLAAPPVDAIEPGTHPTDRLPKRGVPSDPPTWSSLTQSSSATESSAWIPAVRPKEDGDE